MGGSKAADTNTASNCVLLCERCHRFIESYRHEFTQTGWLVKQGKNPAEVPIWMHQQWVYLDNEGNIERRGEVHG